MKDLAIGSVRAFENGVIGVIVRKAGRFYTVVTQNGREVRVKTDVPCVSVVLTARERQRFESLGKHYKRMDELLSDRVRLEKALDVEWQAINKLVGRPLDAARPFRTTALFEALSKFGK